MDIHKVFDCGSELYSDLIYRSNPLGDFSNFDTVLLEKYRRSFVFYKAYKESGYSFIAAYYAVSSAKSPQIQEADDTLRSAMTVSKNICDFNQELNHQIYKKLLLDNTQNKLTASDLPGLIHPHILPYSFLIEVLTCKDVKGIALALIAFGALSLAVAGGVLGVAATGAALNVVGATVTGAKVAGSISALLGTTTLLFGSCVKNQPMAAQAELSALGFG